MLVLVKVEIFASFLILGKRAAARKPPTDNKSTRQSGNGMQALNTDKKTDRPKEITK